MYLAGVSVRRVEDITEALWGRFIYRTESPVCTEFLRVVGRIDPVYATTRYFPFSSIIFYIFSIFNKIQQKMTV